MGMFDSVYFKCPNCGEEIEEQSKAGECILHNYDPDSVPYEIAINLNNEKSKCYECGKEFVIKVDGMIEPPPSYKMILIPL